MMEYSSQMRGGAVQFQPANVSSKVTRAPGNGHAGVVLDVWGEVDKRTEQITTISRNILGDAAGVAGNPGPEVRALLGHGAGDGGALHLALVVHYHPGTVLQKERGMGSY